MPKNESKREVSTVIAKAKQVLDRFAGQRFAECQAVHKTIWGSPAGKKKLADRLAAMLPAHMTYVEPFAGSAAVLFAKNPVPVEVLCDADKEIARAYRTIKRLTREQITKLRSRNWKGDEATFKRLVDTQPNGDLDSLYRFLYLTHFSYGKLRGKSFSPSGAGVESRTVERVEAFAPRLKNVRVYDGDYLKVVRKYDSPSTVFFLDPPYSGHNVDVGESTFDEERFFDVLKSLKGKFLLTYGIRGKLPGLLKGSGFNVQRIRTRRSIRSMRGVGGPTMLTQLVVTNYKPLEKRLVSDDEWIIEDWEIPDEPVEKVQPFGTFGGSHHYAKRIVPLIPEHTTYVEPFAGAAAVLHAKEPSEKEVLADLDEDLVFMHRFIKGLTADKVEKLKGFDWTCTESSWKRVRDMSPGNDLERFYKLAFIRGKGRDARPDATHPAGAAMGQTTNPEKYLRASVRLKDVTILRQDYRKTISANDGPDTFFFIDPPYPGEWFDKDAVIDLDEFISTLKSIKGKFIAVLNDSKENVAAFKQVGQIFRLKVREASGTGGAKQASRLFCANYRVHKCEEVEEHDRSESAGDGFIKTIPLIKAVDPNDERFVLGIVLEPDTVDAQGDIYSADEVRQAAHRFMEEFGGLGLMHRFRVNDQVKVLESYLAPVDFELGDTAVKKGTWLLAVRVLSDELWEQVKEGALTGFSIGGSARREVLSPESRVLSEKQALQKSERPAQDSGLETQDSVHRLLDIVVEEVSLVDRAANKHRFLIVKRSNEMSKQAQNDTNDDATSTAPDQADEDVSWAEDETETAEDSGAEDSPTLETAVSALQGLLEAVTLLGGADADHAQVRGLADELRAAADRLSAGLGDGAPQPDKPADAEPPDLNAVIAAVKETLQRVTELLPQKMQREATPPTDTNARLDAIIEDIKRQTALLQQQQQRLAKLEKRSGLPSSVPAGETLRKKTDEDVGWPMDMNRSLDKESVDKAVSFHEV